MSTEIVANDMTREQIDARMDELSTAMYDLLSIERTRWDMREREMDNATYMAGRRDIQARHDAMEDEYAALCIAIGEKPPVEYITRQRKAARGQVA